MNNPLRTGTSRPHLTLASDDTHVHTPPQPVALERPALVRLCAGEALLLTEDEVDLVALVNDARTIHDVLLDDGQDPNQHRLAEVLIEHYCTRYGIHRHANGDRLESVISAYRRYLIPFLVELAAAQPADQRGAGALRLRPLEKLPQMLAGMEPLPAGTVAADRLGRRGLSCVFLTLADAAAVTEGGGPALNAAVVGGKVPLHRDVRTGAQIVLAADLRAAGLLVESDTPHGLAKSTAGNVLRDLRLALERARDLGAEFTGTFRLTAIGPLPSERLRPPKASSGHIPLATVAATAPHLPVIGQVVLWTGRLVGERISEIYGLHVRDYVRDEDNRPWLVVDDQGGRSTLARLPESGLFQRRGTKDHTKTPAGVRTIPIPRQLADLLDSLVAVFHTDPTTGLVDQDARLIPGLRQEDTSGQASFRGWLKDAQAITGVPFDPHDLRAALITDCLNAGIDKRLTHYFAGQELEDPTIQEKHYDLGPFDHQLLVIPELLERQIAGALGTDDLRAPTTLREQWGRATRWHRQADWIEEQLVATRWRAVETVGGRGPELEAAAVASWLGKSVTYTRSLMRDGTIPAHTRLWGSRPVWVSYLADVERYQASVSGPTIANLAAELGRTYPQVWQLLRELGRVPAGHAKGAALRLSAETVQAVRAEVARRDAVRATAMTVKDAARQLAMEVVTVETLIRQGHLEVTESPDRTRQRYVTRNSVDTYGGTHPCPPPRDERDPAADADTLLTCAQARQLLKVTRPALSSLVATRQLQTGSKPGSRHVYVTAASAIAWAQRTERPWAATAIQSFLDSGSS